MGPFFRRFRVRIARGARNSDPSCRADGLRWLGGNAIQRRVVQPRFSRSCECPRALGEAADLDNLAVVGGEDLKDQFGGRRPRSPGLPGHSDAHHDCLSVDLHALGGMNGAGFLVATVTFLGDGPLSELTQPRSRSHRCPLG